MSLDGVAATRKRVAVLLDLGFVFHALHRLLGGRRPTAHEIQSLGHRCVASDEALFRLYCYHCRPLGRTERHPLSGERIDFSASATFREMHALLRDLERLDTVAFREGTIAFTGWMLRPSSLARLTQPGATIEPADIQPDIRQKQVDMKIGLDVAWLASRRIVDRLILVTADRDFIPAMKFARREGVQVVIAPLGRTPHRELAIHADAVRTVGPVASAVEATV